MGLTKEVIEPITTKIPRQYKNTGGNQKANNIAIFNGTPWEKEFFIKVEKC